MTDHTSAIKLDDKKDPGSQIHNQSSHKPLKEQKDLIKQIYLQLLDDFPEVEWKCLMFHNAARPKPYSQYRCSVEGSYWNWMFIDLLSWGFQ